MTIIIGLGNPGEKYENTRHNIGFMVIDEFKRNNNFPDFKLNKKYKSFISQKNNILLVKPYTFMNNSGKAIKEITKHFATSKNFPNNLIVIHDDIDIPLGEIKIVQNRGSAGNKGVESIIKELKSKNFIRFRIGINQWKENKKRKAESVVLKKLSKKEKTIFNQITRKTSEAISFFLEKGLMETMNKFNNKKWII